jgi:hypothetical protein
MLDRQTVRKAHACISANDGLRQRITLCYIESLWGSSVPDSSRLSLKSARSMQRNIDLRTLAKNFQDAILITRALRLRFLWIDALCILQDSKEDWASEAPKMAQYYSGSGICIAATAAPHVQHGILHPRTLGHAVARLEGQGEGLSVRKVADDVLSLIAYQPLGWRPSIPCQPLNSRSWTFQERLFAKRTVHYTEQRMIWQC